MKMEAGAFKAVLPGLVISLTIALFSYLVSSMHMSFDTLTVAVIFGMLVSNMLDEREGFLRGAETALKMFLPLGIAFYGLEMRVRHDDLEIIAAVYLVCALMFSTTYLVSRGFGIQRRLSALLGSGMAVCGSLAIAVLSPSLGAKREETSIAMIAVVVVGLAGMLAYRFMPDLLGMDSQNAAFMAGTTLPLTGQVKVVSTGVVGKALGPSFDLKLLRIPLVSLVAASAVIVTSVRAGRVRLPWYMAAFFAFAVAVNVSGMFEPMRMVLRPVSGVFLTIALAAVGLSVDFDSLTRNGTGPILAVIISFSITVLALYLVLTLAA